MAEFVLEIGTEEMPARFLPGLTRDLETLLAKALDEAQVEYDQVRTLATPRRLVAHIPDLAQGQQESEELVTGPPLRVAFDTDGNPTKAGAGFAKTQGVDLADTFTHATDKGEYLAVRKKTGGGKTIDLLPGLLGEVIQALPFPKRMRWGANEFAFGRSIRWLLALMQDTVVEFEVASIASSNQTLGHRVHGFGPWDVTSAKDYFTVLKDKGQVVLDEAERKAMIVEQGNGLAAKAGGSVVWNDALLQEVAGLVEFPRMAMGTFEDSFLELPRQVLLTSMQSHQKSFGVEDGQGKLLPHFLTALNIEPKDIGLVQKGWERVLRARLEDGRFFWITDLKQDLQTWLDELDNVVFLGPLGSMGDKARRLEKLCAWLAQSVDADQPDLAARAGRLAKADLVSEMVGEFDKLQGVMGGIYAAKQGEDELVATAISEQYLPAGPDTPVPDSLFGALLSLADKADTLVGCFGLDMIPTGAADPYALRRGALGICRLIIEKGLRIDLMDFLAQALDLYGGIEWKLSREDVLAKLEEFVAQRLKGLFTSQGFETLVVEAAVSASIKDVWALKARVEALAEFSKEPDFEQAVLTFKRAGNIILKQGQEAGVALTGQYQADQLQEDAEKALASAIAEFTPRFDELWARDDFGALMAMLRELRPSVDSFFDNVMVMCEDPALRLNRLNLLKALVDPLSRVADFNALQV
ncbi:MAG: glycine--tRNA ligase subunit beta [Desulfovibrio sp.]|nr:MAG: glycine--tRNA ligase subunit beta [Desulfovibrio sp.]